MQSQIFGYTITSTGEAKGPAYILTKKNRQIGLLRNQKNPNMLFTIDLVNFLKPGKIKGHDWFTDQTGELKPAKI